MYDRYNLCADELAKESIWLDINGRPKCENISNTRDRPGPAVRNSADVSYQYIETHNMFDLKL